ncbi:MAG: ATP-dependent RNA helicase HrpA [Gammaproteobacteria bacterium]|nr:MAG: ATP-dependent RNA helicase HrpA [Gammaproteobacteria bacterium]
MLADRHPLRRRLRAIARRARKGHAPEEALAVVEREIERSAALARRRRETLPQPEFPAELPITARLEEIRSLIGQNQVVILCGETGSGKSTQLPKICLSLGRGVFGRIAHTQPRRIAARSLASRISSELGTELGSAVGYKVRFHDRVGEGTHVKLLTDGMLLAEIQQDRWLNEYDTIILDEAHERSLNIDFLLGYLKQLLPKRPDLKLIVTSATIDPEKFSRHFGDAPVSEVSGRTYPVEVRYRPPQEESDERGDPMQQAILEAVDELSAIDRGDILVFLSGEREIRETAESLRKHRLQVTEVLPLYARLSPAEQGRIFRPSGQRRIVLSTNVAETSLTVPGIRYVIDAGYARISRYSARSKIQRLPVERISRASADQRKGRCGRVAEGVCIRLYSEEDYESRPEFTEAEILRTNLAAVILQMKVLGFGDIQRFPFVDPPDSRQVKDGYRVLEEIGAVDGLGKVTQLGRRLARLPVDPRIGRMLLEAAHTGCLREVLVIAAALSVQDPRDRPMDKQQQADEAHDLFRNEESDFLGFLSLWNFLEEKRRHLTQRKFRRLCRDHFLSWTRVQEWHDIHRQLRVQLHEMGYRDNQEDPGYETIHRALLSGLLSHVGFRQGGKGKGYLGARNSQFHLFPGSGLFEKQPKWLMAAELVETTRLYARTCARIQPEWVESLAGHLVKHSYSEPHWQARRGQVGAYEKVTLFGLTLVPRRRVNFGPIDPKQSREIFIRFALVEGDFHSRAPFWRHNRELIEHVQDLEARTRRPDLLVDEERIYEFYDQRIPEGIYSQPQFEKWLRKATRKQPKLLHMRLEDVLAREVTAEAQYPKELTLHGMTLPLEYRFEPGHRADGVTLVVPAAVIRQISPGRLDWLVPGMLEEKLVALIRSLPKSLRKQFVPAPDHARQARARLTPGDTPLVQALGRVLRELTGVQVPEDAWDLDALPDHLKMRVRVVDGTGKTLGAGRDLIALQQRHGDVAAAEPAGPGVHPLGREGITRWDFGELPEQVETQAQGIRLTGWSALVDKGDSVAIEVLGSRAEARLRHRAGLRRLILLALPAEIRELRRRLQQPVSPVGRASARQESGIAPDATLKMLRLQYAKAPSPPLKNAPAAHRDLEDELIALVIDRAFLDEADEIRDEMAFDAALRAGRPRLHAVSQEVHELVSNILGQYQAIRKRLSGLTQINWLASTQDMQGQLDRLVFRGFLQAVPWERLRHYPRYLRALALRLEKLPLDPGRDQRWIRELQQVQEAWLERWQAACEKWVVDERLEEIRWLIEELRISLFAQEVKTAVPVSVKRIRKRWNELGL